ncbi:uncharacterized protein [Elaeis guineensis]|uniref:Uncharacterized protein LOC105049263 n=1 Tax=Elaeis guineensis var. tenera TaxID=51953 RepID=A0A6I9RI56_ELAGV|nr:uncharacterized protein LOC105049263 [Elaeis guineensis]
MASNVPMPTGYHFRPSPRELVKSYLRRRLLKQPLPCGLIKDLNIYDFHPRDILSNAPAGKHLYFFTPRKTKNPNGTRSARGINGGYWKASGRDIIIRDETRREIAHRKFLVFYEGHQRDGRRTSWRMQEYTIKEFWFPTNQNNSELGALALCEIFSKPTLDQSRDGEVQVDEEEEEDEGMASNVPVPTGYHFRPSPRELVKSYLRRRLLKQPLPCGLIKDLNIYDFHPRDILGNTRAGKHLYFFTPRKKKYPKGTRPARETNGGYWKASGRDMIIKDKNKKEIGHKKFLVFHEGHQRDGRRTSWLMHEYTIKEFWFPTNQNNDKLGALALCEIYLKPTSNRSRGGELQAVEEEEGSAYSSDDSDIEDNIIADRLIRPHPAQCNHDNDRRRAPIAFTNECPLGSPSACGSSTARPVPSTPLLGYNNMQGHNMVLIPQYILGPSGPLQPEASYLCNRTAMPGSNPEQPDFLVHSFYCPYAPSSSSGNQMMPPPQHGELPSPEFGVATASSSQYEVSPQRMPPSQLYLEASQLMPSAFETTLWPPPRPLR